MYPVKCTRSVSNLASVQREARRRMLDWGEGVEQISIIIIIIIIIIIRVVQLWQRVIDLI